LWSSYEVDGCDLQKTNSLEVVPRMEKIFMLFFEDFLIAICARLDKIFDLISSVIIFK